MRTMRDHEPTGANLRFREGICLTNELICGILKGKIGTVQMDLEIIDSCDAHMLKAAGVYAILNENEEIIYIGQTDCFIKRWGEHCSSKRNQSIPLEQVFQFVVLAYEDSRPKREELERVFTAKHNPKYYRKSAESFRPRDPLLNKYNLRQVNWANRRREIELEERQGISEDELKSILQYERSND